MQFRSFFLSILAGAALAAGCAQEQVISSIAEFRVDKSYIGLPLGGGSNSSAYEATASWSFDTSAIPDWLTITPTSGGAGSDYIVFFAEPNTGDSERSVELRVTVGGKQQRFTIYQAGPGEVEAPLSTIAEVMAGNDGQTFRIRGTVTSIVNTNYGNLYIADDTGSIYIYGLFNAKGQYPKDAGGWATFGVDAGDVITVQGPRTLYNGTTLELVDATLISVEKSLIEVDPADVSVGSEAGTFAVSVVSKANGMVVLPSENWVRVTDIAAGEGEAVVIPGRQIGVEGRRGILFFLFRGGDGAGIGARLRGLVAVLRRLGAGEESGQEHGEREQDGKRFFHVGLLFMVIRG